MNKPLGGQPQDDQPHDSKIKPADLLDLPHEQRQVMRVMLRHASLGHEALLQTLGAWPEVEPLQPEVIETAIGELVRHGWLIRIESAGKITYHVGEINRTFALNQDPKAPPESQDATVPSRRTARVRNGMERINNFWGKLDPETESDIQTKSSRIARHGLLSEAPPTPAQESNPRPPSSLLDELKPKTSPEKPTTAGPARNEAQREGFISSLFKEFAGGKAKSLEELPEDQRRPASRGAVPDSGGGRISKLFDELSGRSKKEKETED